MAAFFYEDDDASLNENHTTKIRHGKVAEREFPVFLIPPPEKQFERAPIKAAWDAPKTKRVLRRKTPFFWR